MELDRSDICNMTTNEIVKTIQVMRNCLNCKFISLTVIDGKIIAACRYVEPAHRLYKFGYCGFWQLKIIDLRLPNRLKRENKISLKKYIEEYGEDCNTCANALSSGPFIGCDLKVKDFTYQDEVICCRYYEFKGFIEE